MRSTIRPSGVKFIEMCRETGESRELEPALCREAEFHVPVFFTWDLIELITPGGEMQLFGTSLDHTIINILKDLRRITQAGCRSPVTFTAGIPMRDSTGSGVTVQEVAISATLADVDDEPFILVCDYDSVADVL